jgi:putative membrane protein
LRDSIRKRYAAELKMKGLCNMMIFGLFLLLIFWGGLIALAIWLVKSLFASSQRFSGTSQARELSAGEILDQRYARGEITREQYELMKSDLV